MTSKSLFLRRERTLRIKVLDTKKVMGIMLFENLGRVIAGTRWCLILDRSIPSMEREKTET